MSPEAAEGAGQSLWAQDQVLTSPTGPCPREPTCPSTTCATHTCASDTPVPHLPVPLTPKLTPVPHTPASHTPVPHTAVPHTPVSPICREPASHLTEVMSGGDLSGQWPCYIPRLAAAGDFSGRGGGGGLGHSLPQSYHLPGEPQRPPHTTPMGGRGPPRLAESWAKRSNGASSAWGPPRALPGNHVLTGPKTFTETPSEAQGDLRKLALPGGLGALSAPQGQVTHSSRRPVMGTAPALPPFTLERDRPS